MTHRADSGFALPAVLIVVGMLALVFLVAILALDTLASQTRRAKQRVEFEQAALSLEAKSAWLALTEPMSEDAILIGGPRAISQPSDADHAFQTRSIVPLHLDGRAYGLGGGRLSVALRDGAGQINLDMMSPQARPLLMAAMGVATKDQAALVDRLGDDLDPDDLKRINGAEANDYAAAGMSPLRNGAFTRVAEVFGVLGWRETVPRDGWLRLRDDLTVDPTSPAANVNTASAQALEIVFGLRPDQARAAVAARAAAAFLSMADLARVVGPVAYDNERTYTRPNGRFALKVTAPQAGLVYRARIVLTPSGLERPLWIEERSLSEATGAERTPLPANATVFPDPSH